MQHKQRSSRLKIVFLMVIIVLIAGFAVLMTANIPAPTHPVQKSLDTKDFLEQKPS